MRIIRLAQSERDQQIAALPPIPEGYIRLVHQSNLNNLESIKQTGLRYPPVAMGLGLDSTTHAISDMSQFDSLKDKIYRVGGELMHTLFLDITIDNHNRHLGRRQFMGQEPPGLIPPNEFNVAGMIDPLSSEQTTLDFDISSE